jgi:glycosyltransferase involved in cell wall biosynthesis
VDRKIISIVSPCYKETLNIFPLLESLDRCLANEVNYYFEYILVNDGSPDKTWDVICEAKRVNNRLVGIDLSKNFGKEIALSAGVSVARGDAIICIDSDLQHPPKEIPRLIREWEKGFEVVGTIREDVVKPKLIRRIGSKLFYWLMETVSTTTVPARSTDFRLIDKKVAKEFLKMPERARIYRGMIDWLGYRKTWITFVPDNRNEGEASYTTKKLLTLMIDSFLSHSVAPLMAISWVGFFISVLSFILLFVQTVTFIFGNPFAFRIISMVIVFNTLLFGVVLVAIGAVALYVSRIYTEVIGRPLFVIRERL